MRRPWILHRLTSRHRPPPTPAPAEVTPAGSPLLLVGAVIAVIAVVSFITFLIAIKGRERTLVPNVQGMDLLEALPQLQERGLGYAVAPAYSSDVPRNGVIGQRPTPGAVVKQGRVVELSVSRGAILDKIPDYVGWTLRAVRENIGAVFSSTSSPLLKIVDPPSYIHATRPEGTILEQDPAPETPITGVTDLHFVVSLGPEGETVTVADYVGLPYTEALAALQETGLGFLFTVEAARAAEAGEVVSQSPRAESRVPPDSLVQLWMKAPEIDEEIEVFDVLKHDVPVYAVRVPVRVEIDTRDEPTVLYSAPMHPGGLLTIPYVARKSDEIVVLVDDREVARIAADPQRR